MPNHPLTKRLIQLINRANFGQHASNRYIPQVAVLLETAGSEGDARAIYWLGMLNWDGWGVSQNRKLGLQLLHAAAARGNRDSLFNLGVAYDNGYSVEQNRMKAFSYFLKAARLGEKEAMHSVGHMLSTGEGVVCNPAKAKYWFLQAAENGFARAMYNVASCYQTGEGTRQNTRLAMHWFERALEHGETWALTGLGFCYYKLVSPPDFVKAQKYFERASEFNHPNAMYNLGLMADKGDVGPQLLPDAIFWYERAALAGHEGAMLKLAKLKGEDF